LNVHHSLLPRWRGPAPVQAAILAGDRKTGVTISITTQKVDAGGIVAQKEVDILSEDTYLDLENRLIAIGSKLLLETLPEYLEGKIAPKPQDESQATYTKLIKKKDGKIDWSHDAEYIERMVRAYYLWPGAYTQILNKTLKIKKAVVVKTLPSSTPGFGTSLKPGVFPGKIFAVDGFPVVTCGKDALKLLVVHPEGKKEMPGDAYLRGHST